MPLTVTITIPDAFLEHWEGDRFADSLRRISGDIRWNLNHRPSSGVTLAGLQDAEVAEMLNTALADAEILDD